MNDRDLAEALSEGIVCLEADGQLLWWNSAASNLLRLEQQTGKHSIFDVIQLASFSDLFNRQQFNQALELPSPCFSRRYITAILKPYGDKCLLVLHDVTHTHRLNSIRQDFIANVSHELRTPLTVFHGYLEILLDNQPPDPAVLQDVLRQMMAQSQRMASLVKDLLLLSRLESAEPDPAQHRSVNLAGLIRMTIRDAKALSGNKNHKFILDLDSSIVVAGDAEELHSALSNLIFNAVHYTQAQGTIHVSLHNSNGVTEVSIKDNGIGIAQKDISKITQRFYRVDKARSREGDKGGTGLGLAIVKHVLLRHHAELLIDSVPEKGSCFICRFLPA